MKDIINVSFNNYYYREICVTWFDQLLLYKDPIYTIALDFIGLYLILLVALDLIVFFLYYYVYLWIFHIHIDT